MLEQQLKQFHILERGRLKNEMVQKESVGYDSPYYLQVRELVKSKIEAGEFRAGTALPSDNVIANLLGLSRLTVNAALEGLVKEGLILRIQGKGSYVVGKRITRDLERLQGFNQTMDGKNVNSSVKILKKSRRKAGLFFGEVFEIDPEEYIYYIERLCYIEDQISSIEEIYVPDEIMPKLEGIDLSVFSLYEVYEFYGIELSEAEQTLEVVELDKREAKLLKIENDKTGLLIECKTYNENHRLIEYSKNFTRRDISDYTVQFGKY